MDIQLLSLLNPQQKAVVIDLGAAFTKAGFVGEPTPRIIPTKLASLSGKQLSLDAPPGMYSKEEWEEAMFFFLQRVLVGEMLANPKENRVVICENIFSSKIVREAVASALFRRLQVPTAVFVPLQPFSVFPTTSHTGLVIDIGHLSTTIVPVFNRLVLRNTLYSFQAGGAAVAERLATLLKEYPSQYDLEASSQQRKEVMQILDTDLDAASLQELVHNYVHCTPIQGESQDSFGFSTHAAPHRVIQIKREVLERASDVLFEPDEDGNTLPSVILDCFLKCNVDVRASLVTNVVLVGGVANLPGFRERLRAQMASTMTDSSPKISSKYASVRSLQDRIRFAEFPFAPEFVGWVGASMATTVDSLYRSEEIDRSKYLQFNEVPDWTNLLDSQRLSTLFKADASESDILTF